MQLRSGQQQPNHSARALKFVEDWCTKKREDVRKENKTVLVWGFLLLRGAEEGPWLRAGRVTAAAR